MVKVAFGVMLLCLGCLQPINVPTRPPDEDGPAAGRRSSPPRGAAADEVASERPRVVPPGGYNMADLPLLSKVLLYVHENYYDASRVNCRRMLLGALQFVQRDVPEFVVEPMPIDAPDRVVVTVSGESRTFRIDRVDQPWNLRVKLQEIFGFAQARLQPVPGAEEGRRLLEIEMSATNGMLYTLDPHSVLLDADTYANMRSPARARAAVGLIVAYDAHRSIRVAGLAPGSPAERAGLRSGDRIIRIDEVPTTVLALDDVVARLQGDIGSVFDLYVERDGARGLQKIHLERALIHYHSVDAGPRVLTTVRDGAAPAAKIGYLHLTHLAADAAGAVEDALRELAREHVGGIVLDLRGNSGGLYEQAVRVVDAFVKQGTIVSMVGVGGSQRKDEEAKDGGGEPDVPVAVLVDHETAAGAEIVAAALRNLDHAVVLGRQTFGMGTVQVLFDIPSPIGRVEEGGAPKLGLKLTTAQFLATGDVPFQRRGLAPDFELRAVTVARAGQRNLFQIEPLPRKRSETNYEWALGPPGAVVPPGRALMSVDYLAAPPAADSGDDERPVTKWPRYSGDDFEATFAAELLAYMGQPGRASKQSVAGFVGLLKAREDARITAAAAQLKIDWRTGAPTPAPRLSLKLESTAAGIVRAGTRVQFRGTVTNAGTTAAFRVRAVLTSDNPAFDGLEMPFGMVPPGETRTFDLTAPISPTAFTRTDVVRGRLRDDGGDIPLAAAAEATVEIESRAAPALSFTCRTIETAPRETAPRAGTGSGRESIKLVMQVMNRGKAAAEEAEATVHRVGQPADDGVIIKPSRWAGVLAAGATKELSFVVDLPGEPRGGWVDLDLAVVDRTSEEPVHARMRISPRSTPKSGAAPNLPWQVEPQTLSATPPRVTVSAPTVASGETVHVTGEVSADTAARDVFIRVWNAALKIPVQKVFYRKAAAETTRLPFEADVPLWPGSNLIQVHARDANGTEGSGTAIVLKRANR